MKFTSAGQLIDPRTVGYRSLGFGEALSIPASPYELRINHSDLPPSFLDVADTFNTECRTDDLAQGSVDIPELAELGYPSFRALLQEHPDLAARLIQDYLYFELFFFPVAELQCAQGGDQQHHQRPLKRERHHPDRRNLRRQKRRTMTGR
ncbi:hypothetical protein [Pseudomonas saponiphila]|uniref:hypothetical protein n=1 Tax=Pseudomonas saponiphila TaxID=556534 RepID=UPI00223F2E15|nr:hypothetical protein [Pseudomonas saponiphila]